MKNKRVRRRFKQEVNAGSMADIAFLLLIFFLVTTTIVEDKGIRVRLPEWQEQPPKTPIPPKNVLNILINAENEVLVESEPAEILSIRETVKEFIMNPSGLESLPSDPVKAVVSLQNDRGTTYLTYVEVYNEIKAAYNELWEVAAQSRFRKSYQNLSEVDRLDIRKDIPLVISEAEPTGYGLEG